MRQHFRKTILSLFSLSAAYLGLIQSVHGLGSNDYEIEKFKHSWTYTALKLQREIDLRTPFNEATFIGTHNSYNSMSYRTPFRYVDPNQKLSLYNQLEMGVRSIELDAHWTTDSNFSKDILLCHGQSNHLGCGIFDRKIGEGLQEIRDWLLANPNEVILIYIERHLDGHEPRLAALLDEYLGQFIFKPNVVRGTDKDPRSCVSLPGTLSKADILKAGKHVLIVTKLCDGNVTYQEQDQFIQKWNDFVFAGIGHIPQNEYEFIDSTITDFTHYPDCGWSTIFHPDTDHSSIWRIFEDRTMLSGIFSPGKNLEVKDMQELMQCGINWPTMDMLSINDPRLGATIWSWAPYYPMTGKGECAIYKKDEGIINVSCDTSHGGFACRDKVTKQIKTMPSSGSFNYGLIMCGKLGPNWDFITPVNGKEMNSLKEAMQSASISEVWLNYAMNSEGNWQGNKL